VSVRILGSKATIFSGASSENGLSYEISDGARVVARDLWYEGEAPRGFAHVHHGAAFTMQASRIASPADGARPAFSVTDLNGSVTLLSNHVDDRIVVGGSGSRGALLGLGTLREYRESDSLVDAAEPPMTALMVMTRQRTKFQGPFSPGSVKVRDTGSMNHEFVRRMLAPAREKVLPSRLVDLPPAVSDVRMFRVWATAGQNNLWLR
jgi:hypothetical protein